MQHKVMQTSNLVRGPWLAAISFLWLLPSTLFNYFTGKIIHRITIMKLTPTDSTLEVEGVREEYRGTTLIIARANNSKFKRIFRQLLKPYKRQMEKNSLDHETSEEVMIAAYARAILVGWENFVDVDGKKWEYSAKNAEEFLSDDPDAFEFVKEVSEDMDRYIKEDEENTGNVLEA